MLTHARRLLATVLCLLLPCLADGARADDDWSTRLAGRIERIEAALALLDQQAAQDGPLARRVAQAHARLLALETAESIVHGSISGQDSLAALTQDVVRLQARLAALHDARAAAAGPAPTPKAARPPPAAVQPAEGPAQGPAQGPAPAAAGPAARRPSRAPRAWPLSMEWSATANLRYRPTGQSFLLPAATGGYESWFQQDGWSGRPSVSVRAGALPTELKLARLLVILELRSPFQQGPSDTVAYSLEWRPQRSIAPQALRTWHEIDTLTVPVPARWIRMPTERLVGLRARAWVQSATTLDGEQVSFDAPSVVQGER